MHTVTITLTVTVAGDDVDWKENLAGTIMDLSFHVADINPTLSGGNLLPIVEQGDSSAGTYQYRLYGNVSKEVEAEILNRKEAEKC
jgi:hypothetical protein